MNKTEKEILVVSFGTASAESRRLNIEAVESAIREAAGGEWTVRRCFTSQMIINIIEKREGVHVDNIKEALDRAETDGVSKLVVQPTHLMNGLEYDKLKGVLSEYTERFEMIALGDPLLTSEEDLSRVADALAAASAGYEDGETALVFMGHGTEAAANSIYNRMQTVLSEKGKSDFYIGTVEAEPSLDDVIEAVKKGKYRRVVLRPLMLVAGNHAVNDMASADDPESWYSRFTAEGYETICVIEGLGQIPAVREIYADHAHRAIASLEF
jgi:sirohydrochlorin cobaltochelatase